MVQLLCLRIERIGCHFGFACQVARHGRFHEDVECVPFDTIVQQLNGRPWVSVKIGRFDREGRPKPLLEVRSSKRVAAETSQERVRPLCPDLLADSWSAQPEAQRQNYGSKNETKSHRLP